MFFLDDAVDYCGYSVLPMALEQDIVVACAASPAPASGGVLPFFTFQISPFRTFSPHCVSMAVFVLDLANTDPRYGRRHFEFKEGKVNIDASVLDWGNYYLCGVKVSPSIFSSSLSKPSSVLSVRVLSGHHRVLWH